MTDDDDDRPVAIWTWRGTRIRCLEVGRGARAVADGGIIADDADDARRAPAAAAREPAAVPPRTEPDRPDPTGPTRIAIPTAAGTGPTVATPTVAGATPLAAARAEAGGAPVSAARSGCYAARERKGVDLYRAERDTKIRARYLAALERGEYRELPGDVYTKGFLRNYALYLGLDPDEVVGQWRRERGDSGPSKAILTVPRPIAQPRPGLQFSPGIVVAALLDDPDRRRRGLARRAGHALRQAADPRGHLAARGHGRAPRGRDLVHVRGDLDPGRHDHGRDGRRVAPDRRPTRPGAGP